MEAPEDNSSFRTSQLRPPSKIPSPGKPLREISESQGNARSIAPSRMLPPNAMKHKLGAPYNEPEPKRKTLAEQAGEHGSRLAQPTPVSRSHIQGQTLAGVGTLLRNPSFSSSVSSRSSRTPSVSSRATSNGSFCSSVGPGARPPSSYNPRSQTSYKQSISSRIPPSGTRPGSSSMDIPSEQNGVSRANNRMGPFSFSSSMNITTRRVRGDPRHQDNTRQFSITDGLSEDMSMLRLDDDKSLAQESELQATSSLRAPLSTPVRSLAHSVSASIQDWRENPHRALVVFDSQEDSLLAPPTPSLIPVRKKQEHKLVPAIAVPSTPRKTPLRSSRASPIKPSASPTKSKASPVKALKPKPPSKFSNSNFSTAFNMDAKFEKFEAMYNKMEETMNSTITDRSKEEEEIGIYKLKIAQLEIVEKQLLAANQTASSELEIMRQKSESYQQRLHSITSDLDDQMRAHRLEIDDTRREHRNDIDQIRRDNTNENDRILRLHRDEIRELEQRTTGALECRIRDIERSSASKLEEERSRRLREVQELEARIASENQHLSIELQKKNIELNSIQNDLESARKSNMKLQEAKDALQESGEDRLAHVQQLQSELDSLRTKISFLESGSKAQSDSFAEMEARLQEALHSAETSTQKLIKEESIRRSLFNQVQELKGNIRVMCRVRPVFNSSEGAAANLTFPDVDKESKELEVLGKEEKSSLGNVTRKPHAFSFDRVFGPEARNQEVFEEISQLVQSALDGYNVCIFCYGQTGSGKTHTMSSADGMIPRATHQIYETATNLKEKGWTYVMEGSFVEVYNEEIHDLLGSAKDFREKKHEIRHDDQRKQTTVTGLSKVALDSPGAVESILKQADSNRSVAATQSNARSSRSHSVFILKLVGHNSTTGEMSEGTLNLVDLAGSERLKSSGAEGDRMKETQNINKSLSCLGDVIGALGQNKEGGHIPYRNSKLTYLLQYSLGGNSKTLMFVMASPLEVHLTETLTSLKFATKVHNTHIGTARRTKSQA